eukprot:6320763-Pyramimonas_sp.AAC.1
MPHQRAGGIFKQNWYVKRAAHTTDAACEVKRSAACGQPRGLRGREAADAHSLGACPERLPESPRPRRAR